MDNAIRLDTTQYNTIIALAVETNKVLDGKIVHVKVRSTFLVLLQRYILLRLNVRHI